MIKLNNNYLISIYLLMLIGGIFIVSWLIEDFVGYLITAALALSLVAFALTSNIEILTDKVFFKLFGLYYVWLLVILALSPSPASVIPYALSTPIILIIIFVFPPVVYEKKYFIPWSLAILGAVLTILGVIFLYYGNAIGLDLRYTGSSTYFEYRYRIQSVFRNSNNYGMFLLFASLASVYLVFRNNSKGVLLLLLINLSGLFLSYGRSSLAGFVIGLIFIFFYKHRRWLSSGLIISILAFHIVILSNIVSQDLLADFLSNRNYYLMAGAEHFMKYPFFGNYFGSVDTAYLVEQRTPGSHNTYFSILTRAGIGALLYIAALLYLFIQSSKSQFSEWHRYIFANLAALFTLMIFETINVGGLSIESLLLATFLGFSHYEIVKESNINKNSAT